MAKDTPSPVWAWSGEGWRPWWCHSCLQGGRVHRAQLVAHAGTYAVCPPRHCTKHLLCCNIRNKLLEVSVLKLAVWANLSCHYLKLIFGLYSNTGVKCVNNLQVPMCNNKWYYGVWGLAIRHLITRNMIFMLCR